MKHIVSGDDSSKTTQQASTGIPDDPAISRMYTPVEVAKEEIWKRWSRQNSVGLFLFTDKKIAYMRYTPLLIY